MATATGRTTRHYFTRSQSAFTEPRVQDGTEAVKLKTALVFSKKQNAQVREDYHPETRDPVEDIQLGVDCTLSATAYMLGVGTQGSGPDIHEAYKTAFSETTLTGTEISGAPIPSTTQFKLASDNLEIGNIGKIDVEDGDDKVIEQRYFSVVAKDGSDVLTIFPPFENAPSAGDVVKTVVQYKPTLSNADAITCYRSDNLAGQMGIGCKFHKFTWKFSQGNPGELNLEGQCRDVIQSVRTKIDQSGGIDDSQTSITVTGAGIEEGSILCCEEELMFVAGVSEDGIDLTVTRGYNSTTASSHNNETEIGAYEPDETTSGSPIRGLHGGVWLGTTPADACFLMAEEVSIEIDEKTSFGHYFGDEGKAPIASNTENRTVFWSIVCYLDSAAAKMMRLMISNSALKAFLQAGKDDGRACAFYSPSVQFDIPEIPDAAGELVKVTLQSRACLAQNGEDSISFAF